MFSMNPRFKKYSLVQVFVLLFRYLKICQLTFFLLFRIEKKKKKIYEKMINIKLQKNIYCIVSQLFNFAW